MDAEAPLDPLLVSKLSRPAVRPGVIDQGLARSMHARHTRMATELPLADVVSRHLGSVSDLAGVPIVYAEPAPASSTQDSDHTGARPGPAVSAPIVRVRPVRSSATFGPSDGPPGAGPVVTAHSAAAAHPVVQMSPMPTAEISSSEVLPSPGLSSSVMSSRVMMSGPVVPGVVVPDRHSSSTLDSEPGEALPVPVPVVVPDPARSAGFPAMPAVQPVVLDPPSPDTVVQVVHGMAPPDVVQRQVAAPPRPALDLSAPNGGGQGVLTSVPRPARTIPREAQEVSPKQADRVVQLPLLVRPVGTEVEAAGGVVVAAERPRPQPVEPLVLVDLAVATAQPVRDQPVTAVPRNTPRSVVGHVQVPGNGAQATRSTQPARPEAGPETVPVNGPVDIGRIVDLVHNRFVRRLAVEAERRGVR